MEKNLVLVASLAIILGVTGVAGKFYLEFST